MSKKNPIPPAKMNFYTSPIIAILSFISLSVHAQELPIANAIVPDPNIKQMLSVLSTDSIVKHVKNLSGETPCKVKGNTVTIKNRISSKGNFTSSTGNDLSADYIKERLESYGYTVIDQVYKAGVTGGRNIIAEKKGSVYPDKKYIMSAHYDAMDNYCADDNASSCSAIIEYARLMSKYTFKYTVVFAFFDEEEIGLLGSKYYANLARTNNVDIKGDYNMDMIAWDSNNDFKIDIHTKNPSLALSTNVVDVNTAYQFALKPNVINPGTDRSDHASFWGKNYQAVTFGEAFFGGDASPHYHKSSDKISAFNLPYYYELCRLGLAVLSTSAEVDQATGIESFFDETQVTDLNTFPNPASTKVNIKYKLSSNTNALITLLNTDSKVHLIITNDYKTAGNYEFEVDTEKLSSGFYVITLQTNSQIISRKLIVEK